VGFGRQQIQGTLPPEVAAYPKVYISYASLLLKQKKKITMKEMKESIGKSTRQGSPIKRRTKNSRLNGRVEDHHVSYQSWHRNT
jgi:hypothetical protein